MRFLRISSIVTLVMLTSCVTTDGDTQAAEQWKSEVEEQRIVHPNCEFKTEGTGNCYYE